MWLSSDLSQLQGKSGYSKSQSSTRTLETARKRGLDTVLTLQKAVQDLESKLEIYDRWEPGSSQWKSTLHMIDTRRYRKALNHLEGLVVARLFELTKAHQSGTGERDVCGCCSPRLTSRAPGVKLRKHIAKALSARSQAIRTAVKNYNIAATALTTPRPTLDVHVVLNHVYLGQFDLLRDSRNEVLQKAWAQPAEREAATAFFKLARSREEVRRVNVEARRLRTFIEDEEEDLLMHAQRLQTVNPALAYQIAKQRLGRVAVNNIHRRRLAALEDLDGYSGIPGRGVRVGRALYQRGAPHAAVPSAAQEDEDGQSEGEDIEHDDDVTDAFESTFAALSMAD